MKRINTMFPLVVALLAATLTGCPMGLPVAPDAGVLTGSCPNRGESRSCSTPCVPAGLQICNFITSPDGSRTPTQEWGVCVGADVCTGVDAGPSGMDGGSSGMDGGGVIADAGVAPVDAGGSGSDAGPPDGGVSMMMCDPALLYACTDVCGVAGSGTGYRICDPAIGLGPCLPFSGSCTPVVPTDCPCEVGAATERCAVVVTCSTPCGYGVQTWQDYCLMNPCWELVTAPMCLPGTDAGVPAIDAGNDAGNDAGPGTMADAGAGAIDAGPPDSGPPDSGPPDAGPPDSGPPDAGPPDSGPPDAGPPDAGPPPVDAGRDSGPPDAGPPDSGPPDAGPPACVPTGPEVCGNATDEDCSGTAATCPSGVTSSGYYLVLSAAAQARCAPSGFLGRAFCTAGERHDSASLGALVHIPRSHLATYGTIPATATCSPLGDVRYYYALTDAERLALLGRPVTDWDAGATVWLDGINVTANSFFCWDEAHRDYMTGIGVPRSGWDADYVRISTSLDTPLTGCRAGTGP